MSISTGQRVKVINQDIWGVVVEAWRNRVIIEDESSEYEWPDNRLEYHVSEVEAA